MKCQNCQSELKKDQEKCKVCGQLINDDLKEISWSTSQSLGIKKNLVYIIIAFIVIAVITILFVIYNSSQGLAEGDLFYKVFGLAIIIVFIIIALLIARSAIQTTGAYKYKINQEGITVNFESFSDLYKWNAMEYFNYSYGLKESKLHPSSSINVKVRQGRTQKWVVISFPNDKELIKQIADIIKQKVRYQPNYDLFERKSWYMLAVVATALLVIVMIFFYYYW
ncbi:hypothetical protein KKF61_03725, partial [Patescibacteria group bacterium]|nr:hypothetical protein [Patescibacteria group bacterium]